MADGGPGPGPRINVFQARLKTDLAGVSSTLTFLPYGGNRVLVNGMLVIVPNAGMTRGVADNLITAAGADSGAAGGANTLYYVYVSNSKATFSPESIRLSATAPTTVSGVKYLGGAGNALNWRFVGWVRLNATPQFESSDTNALIVNYYNRRLYRIFANPGYVDDNAQTTYAVTGNWAKANGGTGSQVKLIANGEDAEIIKTIVVVSSAANIGVFGGPGIDSTPPLVTGEQGLTAAGATTIHSDDSKVLSEGFHTIDLYGATSGAAASFIADESRMGAAQDPRCSMVTVELFV